jgi:putative transposase
MMGTSHKPRLGRLEWLYTNYPVYFLTACVQAKRALLARPEIHEVFIRFAQEASKRHVFVGRYVLMPDHLHLFAAFSLPAPLISKWMKAMKGTLSEALRNAGVRGPYWQKGFFDHVLVSRVL